MEAEKLELCATRLKLDELLLAVIDTVVEQRNRDKDGLEKIFSTFTVGELNTLSYYDLEGLMKKCCPVKSESGFDTDHLLQLFSEVRWCFFHKKQSYNMLATGSSEIWPKLWPKPRSGSNFGAGGSIFPFGCFT